MTSQQNSAKFGVDPAGNGPQQICISSAIAVPSDGPFFFLAAAGRTKRKRQDARVRGDASAYGGEEARRGASVGGTSL